MYTKVWSKQLLMVKPLEYVFASDEALAAQLQEGDSVKINDGMGRTEYKFTGFPTSTTEFSDFTLTVTINKVEEDNGVTFYRARVRWQKSRARFILPDEAADAQIFYYGDGKCVDVTVNVNEDNAELETDAGLTHSNDSVYFGSYFLLPNTEPLPDCTYRMVANGEELTPNDLPKVVPNKDEVFSLIQMKDGRMRYEKICRNSEVKELRARTFTVTPIPSDADVSYSFDACSYHWTQQNGVVNCYKGETITYRVTKAGYKTYENSFTMGYFDANIEVEMEVMSTYRFVYPNGTFNVGDFVLLNDGIGENSQRWTANSTSDTAYQGDFSIQGEVTEIDSQTGFLTVESDVLIYPEVNINADQNDTTITTFGDNQNAIVDIVSDQDGAVIESSAGLETITSVIRGYQSCKLESLSGYTIRLESHGVIQPVDSQFLVESGEVVSYALVYNNRLVCYEQVVPSGGLTRKRHTVNIVPSEADANVTIYGASVSSIQAYSGQVIEYEASKTGYVTESGTYTVPKNNIDNMTYNVPVTLQQEGLNHYLFDKDGRLVECDDTVYLQCSGTQYINTNVYGNQNTSYRVLFNCSRAGVIIFGCRTAYTTNNLSSFFTTDGGYLIMNDIGNSSTIRQQVSANINTVFEVYNSKSYRYVKNVSTQTLTSNSQSFSGSFTTDNPLCIGYHYPTFPSDLSNFEGKIYRCQIYDNGTLIRDFIPVYQGMRIGNYTVPSNGMWDAVNQQFYANAGTGTFNYGFDANTTLPSSYTRLKYISSGSNQYLNTAYYPNYGDTISVGVIPNSNAGTVFCARSNSYDNDGRYLSYITNARKVDYTYNTSYSTLNTSISNDDMNTITMNSSGITANGDTQSYSPPCTSNSTQPIYLLAFNNAGSVSEYGDNKIYYFNATRNGVIIRNMIPALRKSDNVAGLYDTSDGTFYTSATSTPFVAGPEI